VFKCTLHLHELSASEKLQYRLDPKAPFDCIPFSHRHRIQQAKAGLFDSESPSAGACRIPRLEQPMTGTTSIATDRACKEDIRTITRSASKADDLHRLDPQDEAVDKVRAGALANFISSVKCCKEYPKESYFLEHQAAVRNLQAATIMLIGAESAGEKHCKITLPTGMLAQTAAHTLGMQGYEVTILERKPSPAEDTSLESLKQKAKEKSSVNRRQEPSTEASCGEPPGKSLLAGMLGSALSAGDEDDYPCDPGDSLSIKQSRLIKAALAEQARVAEENRVLCEDPHTICIALPQDDSHLRYM